LNDNDFKYVDEDKELKLDNTYSINKKLEYDVTLIFEDSYPETNTVTYRIEFTDITNEKEEEIDDEIEEEKPNSDDDEYYKPDLDDDYDINIFNNDENIIDPNKINDDEDNL
jgi:hypothetical protein